MRYTVRWETARKGQNRLQCQMIERDLEKKYEEVKGKNKSEAQAHVEMCKYLSAEIQVKINFVHY